MQDKLRRITCVSTGTAPYVLNVTWDNGVTNSIDISAHVGRFHVYAPLRGSAELFQRVHVGEHGTDVRWTDDIDIAASTLERFARDQYQEERTPQETMPAA